MYIICTNHHTFILCKFLYFLNFDVNIYKITRRQEKNLHSSSVDKIPVGMDVSFYWPVITVSFVEVLCRAQYASQAVSYSTGSQ
jgi:hypothetical protein